MAREYTPKELKAWSDVESTLAAKGLVVYEQDGKDEANWNADQIIRYYEANPTIEVTVRSITEAVELMKDQMKWLSQAEMEYNRVYRSLTKDQQNGFGGWWYAKASRYIDLDGDNGFSNAKAILEWMRGRAFNNQTFDLAISNLSASRGLHLAPVRTGVRKGHEDSGPFMSREDTNVSPREAARRRAEAAAKRAGTAVERTEPDYKKLADEVVGHTHSQTVTIRRTFITKLGTSDIDWSATYAARRRMAGL